MKMPWDDVVVPDVICPACDVIGTYWEMRTPVRESFSGFEVVCAGVDHADGTTCEEW